MGPSAAGQALQAEAALPRCTSKSTTATRFRPRADEGTPRSAVFVPFAYDEAAINRLTNAALDPLAKIPEFKYFAVPVKPGDQAPQVSSYDGGQLLTKA